MELRDRLALALDVDDLVAALRLARRLRPFFGVAKVGLELFTAAGPDAVASLSGAGFDVFLDLKLHDIPTTVRKAARVIGALGVSHLTLHAHRGVRGPRPRPTAPSAPPPPSLPLWLSRPLPVPPPPPLGFGPATRRRPRREADQAPRRRLPPALGCPPCPCPLSSPPTPVGLRWRKR